MRSERDDGWSETAAAISPTTIANKFYLSLRSSPSGRNEDHQGRGNRSLTRY